MALALSDSTVRGSAFPLVPIVLVLVVHAALIALPSVNSEFAFADAARFFLTGEPTLIEEYFSIQANPVTLPWLTAAVSQVLPGVPLLVVMRLLDLVGVVLLTLGMYRFCQALRRPDTARVITFLMLSPLVWIYAGRSTVDFLPVAVGVFALSIVLRDDLGLLRAVFGGLLFGLAVVLKYHALVLLLPMAALYVTGAQRRPSLLAAAGFLAPVGALLIVYLVLVHETFGFWVTPPEFQEKHHIGLAGWVSNLICYAGYLTLLTLPTVVLLPELRAFLRRSWKWLLPLIAVLLAVGVLWIADNGEMNLGPLDRWVPAPLRIAGFAVISLGALLPLWLGAEAGRESGDRVRTFLWVACIVTLLAFSLTRPAQRYLLFVVPFFLLTLRPRLFANTAFYGAALTLFVLGNVFVEYSRWCTGSAADAMAREIERRGLVQTTDPGAIAPHAAGIFYRQPRVRTDYVVVPGKVDGALVTTAAGAAQLAKSFSLVVNTAQRGQ